jgi:ribulose-5-phosphate 4-epimerase/fuculose-1-phosphate aldolase
LLPLDEGLFLFHLPAIADVHGVIGEDKTVNELHQNAEQFDRKTEISFKYLQVGLRFRRPTRCRYC